MMIGNAREYYEQLVEQHLTDDQLTEKAFDYATRKRLDHKKLDPDHMDVSGVNKQLAQHAGCEGHHHQHNYNDGSAVQSVQKKTYLQLLPPLPDCRNYMTPLMLLAREKAKARAEDYVLIAINLDIKQKTAHYHQKVEWDKLA